MKNKTIVFTIVFILSLLFFENSFYRIGNNDVQSIIDNSKTSLIKKSSVKSEWSEKKKKIKGAAKFDEPNKFMELHRMIRTRDGEIKPGYEINYRISELNKAKQNSNKLTKGNSAASATELNWIERGPANVGGRTRGLYADPGDAEKNTWFAASVGGGVWKTTDAGQNWELKTPDFPNLAMSYFGVSEADPNTIYVGTGEGFGNLDAIPGNGIFKSTDRGETWVQLASTINANFELVNRLMVDPSNENIIIAATGTGIFKSIDGGANWVQALAVSSVLDLVYNPLNFSTMYATKSGNVYKSTDAGDNWIESAEGIAGGRYEIAISPTDTARLYISADVSNSSLFMSTNSGASWKKILDEDDSNVDWLNGQGWYDNAIAVHPYNENIVFYGGIDIWKATIVFDSVKSIQTIEENSTDTFLDYLDSKLSFLNGGGGTGEEYWQESVKGDSGYRNVEIRFGPGMSQKAYRFERTTTYKDFVDVPFQVWDIENNKQLTVCFNDIRRNSKYDLSITRGDEIFISSIEYDSVNIDVNFGVNDGLKYNNLFVITPKNPAGVTWDPTTHPESNLRIITGNVSVVYKNAEAITDGYNQYDVDEKVHVDQHELVVIPMDSATGVFKILNGNDGGVSISNDGGLTWAETDNNGYNTSQFYGADKRPGASEYFGGMQDNGTWQSATGSEANASTSYDFRIGGDGYETSWHYENANKMIGGSQYNRFWKSADGGNSFTSAGNGFDGWGNSAISPFVSKIAKTNSDPDLLFTITRGGVWRTDDFAEKWALSPITNLDNGGSYFSTAQVAISIANPQIVWAGSYLNSSATPNVSKDGGFKFSAVSNFPDVNMGRIAGLDTHPNDEATAYLTFGFADAPKILRTTDYGQSWEDISGFGTGIVSTTGFPNVAVFAVLVMPYDNNIIWAGTDIGVVESSDNGVSWHLLESSLPAVSVWQLNIVDDQVVAATHGRGIWSITLPELSGYTPPAVALAPRINGDINVGTNGIIINASLRSVYDSTQVIIDGISAQTIISSVAENIIINVSISDPGNKVIYLKSYVNGKTLRSSSFEIFAFELLEAKKGYFSGFHSDVAEFVLDGFEIGDDIGFTSSVLQTPHPYEVLSNYYAILRNPIIVAASDATLSYKDVAIIETGDDGTVFGDTEFWDYVIIEASDGGPWKPLLDGYDATSSSTWLEAYDGGNSGVEAMYKNHTVNLLDHFNANDTILIRFRLFSDELSVGWGWAIDDLIIQGQFTSVDDNENIPMKYSLNQNYPNPFNPSTTISFAIPQKSDVSIQIFNVLGQLVKTLYNKETNIGYHNIIWNAKVSSGVYYYSIKAGDYVETKKMVLLK